MSSLHYLIKFSYGVSHLKMKQTSPQPETNHMHSL